MVKETKEGTSNARQCVSERRDDDREENGRERERQSGKKGADGRQTLFSFWVHPPHLTLASSLLLSMKDNKIWVAVDDVCLFVCKRRGADRCGMLALLHVSCSCYDPAP